MKDVISELTEYAELDGSEWGETVENIITLYSYYAYFSDNLREALEKEMKDFLKNVQKNAVIREEPVTITKTGRYLDWNV